MTNDDIMSMIRPYEMREQGRRPHAVLSRFIIFIYCTKSMNILVNITTICLNFHRHSLDNS